MLILPVVCAVQKIDPGFASSELRNVDVDIVPSARVAGCSDRRLPDRLPVDSYNE
ncbi:MAG: hypothetical protein ACK50J_23200 [Planctomyces sp.]